MSTTDQAQRGLGHRLRRERSEPSTEPPSPQPNPVRQRRRPLVIGLGVALVALGTLAGAWYGSQTAEVGDVLVLRADKEAGQGLSLEDLRGVPVAVGPGLNPIPVEQVDSYVGQLVTGNLPAGTILTQDMLSEGVDLPIGTSLVGVALTPAQMPATGLRPGDEVTLVVGTGTALAAPAVEGPGDAQSSLTTPGRTWRAEVLTVGTFLHDNGAVTVDLALPSSDASDLAAASASGNLVVVLHPHTGR